MRAAGCSARSIGSQVRNSLGVDQPRRVLMETGKLVAALALLKHSMARSGVLIMAAPPPVLLTFLSGQPKLRSTPAKPRSFKAAAHCLKWTGSLPQIWAMMGGSVGTICNRSKAFARPFSEA